MSFATYNAPWWAGNAPLKVDVRELPRTDSRVLAPRTPKRATQSAVAVRMLLSAIKIETPSNAMGAVAVLRPNCKAAAPDEVDAIARLTFETSIDVGRSGKVNANRPRGRDVAKRIGSFAEHRPREGNYAASGHRRWTPKGHAIHSERTQYAFAPVNS